MRPRPGAGRFVAALAVWLGALVLGLVAEDEAFGWYAPRSWVPDLVVGMTLVTAGTVAWVRGTVARRTASLVVAAGILWWSGNFAGSEPDGVAWLAGQLTFAHRALLVHAALEGLGAVRRWDGRAVLVLGYVGASPWWATTPEVSALLALGLVAVAVRRTAGVASPALSRPISLAALVLAATLLVPVLPSVLGGSAGPWLLLYQAGVSASALALTLPWRRTLPFLVTDLVVRLGDETGALTAVLADLLGDPGISIVEAPGDGGEVPGVGDGHVATLVSTAGPRATLLVHRSGLRDDPELLAAVVGAVALLLENDRLHEDLRGLVAEVEASRARLVRVADEEGAAMRARLERGAGARLDTVVAQLKHAADASRARRSDHGGTEGKSEVAALVEHAAKRAAQVRQDLADVERALVPDLEEQSLTQALEELARVSQLPVTVTADGLLDVPRDVAAVAWFVCAEGLTNVARHAQATGASISVSMRDGRLRVAVVDDGRVGGGEVASGTGLRNLRDRVEALGGELRIGRHERGGTTLAAELPLGGPFIDQGR